MTSWATQLLMIDVIQITFGIILSIVISLLAYRLGSLSRSGAWAAFFNGALIFGLGGLPWATLLLAFFVSSSWLSRAFRRQKMALHEKFAKGSRRDWGQVLANGGLGTAVVMIHTLLPEQAWPWAAYLGAMAAVNSDTWATEIGVLSRSAPRLITQWLLPWHKRTGTIEKGTSGGVTPLGTLAALVGAAFITAFALLFSPPQQTLPLLIAGLIGGLSGSIFDSWLGATVQGIYYCPQCTKETEHSPRHSCGTATTHQRGWRWLNNDWVNFLCSAAGAGVTVVIWRLLLG